MSRQIILYGAGAMGRRAFEYYAKDNPNAVYCFADTFKGGTDFCGKPVISYNEFMNIYMNYDVVICIFNLFELLKKFAREDIHIKFTVWQDHLAASDKEKEEYQKKFCNLIRNIDKDDGRKKILYGAGFFGNLAHKYYGDKKIFAFADISKSGSKYLGKNVIHPKELKELYKNYEIIVCVADYKNIVDYLIELDIKDFKIFIQLEDMRIHDFNMKLNPAYKDTLFDIDVMEELSKHDFIENPGIINEYYNKYIAAERIIFTEIKPNKERVYTRSIGENFSYGHFYSMRNYAGRTLEYYEAPAVIHAYDYHYDINFNSHLSVYNLIETGIASRIRHNNNKDCLIFVTGPFFHYADPFYDDESFKRLKSIYGKNLTVFPAHSLASIDRKSVV